MSQTSQKLLLPFDDDSWWSRVGNNEGMASFPPLDEPLVCGEKEEKTVWFESRKLEEVMEVENHENVVTHHGVESEVEEEVEEEEEELYTLDDTWKAIMDAKNKGGEPLLKKSGTWTAGDRSEAGNGGKGKLERDKVELKKWSTFGREVGQEEKDCPTGGDGGGWRVVETGLTFHDELKKRADAFIARVTYDMHLQRMKSEQRKFNAIRRGIK